MIVIVEPAADRRRHTAAHATAQDTAFTATSVEHGAVVAQATDRQSHAAQFSAAASAQSPDPPGWRLAEYS